MEVVYMCHGGFKNMGLRERSLTENGGGGFRTGPHVKKGVLEPEINIYFFFLKKRIFSNS